MVFSRKPTFEELANVKVLRGKPIRRDALMNWRSYEMGFLKNSMDDIKKIQHDVESRQSLQKMAKDMARAAGVPYTHVMAESDRLEPEDVENETRFTNPAKDTGTTKAKEEAETATALRGSMRRRREEAGRDGGVKEALLRHAVPITGAVAAAHIGYATGGPVGAGLAALTEGISRYSAAPPRAPPPPPPQTTTTTTDDSRRRRRGLDTSEVATLAEKGMRDGGYVPV
jgi:hypothetical protein